jgi:hypothetical protein
MGRMGAATACRKHTDEMALCVPLRIILSLASQRAAYGPDGCCHGVQDAHRRLGDEMALRALRGKPGHRVVEGATSVRSRAPGSAIAPAARAGAAEAAADGCRRAVGLPALCKFVEPS